MSNPIEIKYNDTTIYTGEAGVTFALPCANKYMAGDISVTTDGSGTVSIYYGETKIVESTTSAEYILTCHGQMMSDNLTGEVEASGPATYITFESPASFTLSTYNGAKNWDGALYVSTDKSTWTEWAGTSAADAREAASGYVLYVRGSGNSYITGNDYTHRLVLTGSNIGCTGNIENLLDWETVEAGNHPTMADYCFYNLFRDCTSLTSAPSLPATTLGNRCYANMFNNCTSLTSAPSLPATTLGTRCYGNMFYNCTSLTNAPSLPATTLTDYCYYAMFFGCTSLTSAPSLSATTLGANCYNAMFSGCTNMETIPALPAATLAASCYFEMFKDCAKIKISTTQTGDYTNQYRIPTSDTGTTATNSTSSMFAGTGGTFTSQAEINTTYYTSNTVV